MTHFKGIFREYPVKVENRFRCQWFMSKVLSMNHCREVVENHLFTDVARTSPSSQHLLGHSPRRTCTLQLARGDRFLNERTDQVAITSAQIGHDVFGNYAAARLLIDAVDHLLDLIDIAKLEWFVRERAQWQLPLEGLPSPCGRQPPVPKGHVVGWLIAPHVIPMEVPTPAVDWVPGRDELDQRPRVAAFFREQVNECWRLLGDLHPNS